jgi:DNA-binding protein Fis
MKEESELSRTVRRAIDGYFRDLDGNKLAFFHM